MYGIFQNAQASSLDTFDLISVNGNHGCPWKEDLTRKKNIIRSLDVKYLRRGDGNK